MSEDLEAELACIAVQIKEIEDEINGLLNKKHALVSKKRVIKERLQEHASEILSSQDWERSDHPWSEKVFHTLKSAFKMDKFRSHQLSTINAVMSQHDCILLMPTGGGKSLCYQLPALVLPGITLVVSPLVSLMEDQIMAMETLNIPAALLNANSSRDHVNNIHKQMTEKNPTIKLLYVTPEKLAKSKRFMSKLEKMYKMGNFSLLAIDEVHCCSQWGHDFRTDYKFLGIMKRQFPKVPILGLTATATSSVIIDVQNILNIQGCLVLRASFNRPNLKYEVVCKSSCQKDNIDELENMLKNRFNGLTGIIYCFSIKDSEEISSQLRKRSVKARAYHAQLDAKARSSVHQSWSSGSIQVIVATVAFGMGIDKPDVRFVIHHSLPKSMENFYQESGRAGRDDNPASCILFYRFPDMFRQSVMVFPEQKGLEHLYAMVSYCLDLSRCRRAIIAEHFGERWDSSDCNNMCDHCDKFNPYVEKTKNVIKEYKTLHLILDHCNMIDERLTSQKLIDIWQGKGSPKSRPPGYQPTSLRRETCERIIALLLIDNYLEEDFHFTPYANISYITIGKRNIPTSGELLLPLSVLRAKVEIKSSSQDRKSVSKENGSSTSGSQKRKLSSTSYSDNNSSTSGSQKTKLSSTSYAENDSGISVSQKIKLSPTSDSPSNSLKSYRTKDLHADKTPKKASKHSIKSSKKKIKVELCVVNKKKSHFHNNEVIDKSDDESVKELSPVKKKSPVQIDISDSELNFDDYEEINHRKKNKTVPMIVVSDSE